MIKDTAFSSFGRSDGFGASFPSKLAGTVSGRTGNAVPAFYSVTPPIPFIKPTTGAASTGCHRKEQAQRGWGVSYEALREWQLILYTKVYLWNLEKDLLHYGSNLQCREQLRNAEDAGKMSLFIGL